MKIYDLITASVQSTVTRAVLSTAFASLGSCYQIALAADATTAAGDPSAADDGVTSVDKPMAKPPLPARSDWIRLSKTDQIWIDKKQKHVVLGGEVCTQEGPLEMFACPKGSKDYESVVGVHAKAFLVHTALLAVGAKPGSPVKFAPTYVPASGTVVDIDVVWIDDTGQRQRVRAQEWVRQVKTEKPMPFDWVFAGSGFWTEEGTGQRHYLAESGDLICVSNFSSATLDLPVQSSQSNDGLMFDAFAKKIPAVGTPVQLILKPRLPKPASPDVPSN